MNQYSNDLGRFVELLSEFTGISKNKISNFLKCNTISTIFEHPAALSPKAKHIDKINNLKLIRNYYLNLKENDSQYVINCSTKAGEYFTNFFMDYKDKEKFVCSFLDARNRIIATSVMSDGTVNEAPVYPREVVKKALIYDAKNVILSHNHPGGSTEPSAADLKVTNMISQALSSVDIIIVDHIIVAEGEYISLAERGFIRSLKLPEDKVIENSKKYKFTYEKFTKKKRKRLNKEL